MEIGVCCSLEDAAAAKAIGYDYFETNFSAMAQLDDEAFADCLRQVRELDFYPRAMNVLLPGSFRLTGDHADPGKTIPYLERGFARAAQLGTESVVFGSGAARNLPAGDSDRERGYSQIVGFARMAGKIAAKNKIKIAIEALCFREANIINLVSEAVYLAERVNLPSVRVLADFYHMGYNRESVSIINAYAGLLEHCHIAQTAHRTYPVPDDGQDYRPIFAALRSAGYQRKISIEASLVGPFEEDARIAHDYLRQLIATA